jgi:hypothetical protein
MRGFFINILLGIGKKVLKLAMKMTKIVITTCRYLSLMIKTNYFK